MWIHRKELDRSRAKNDMCGGVEEWWERISLTKIMELSKDDVRVAQKVDLSVKKKKAKVECQQFIILKLPFELQTHCKTSHVTTNQHHIYLPSSCCSCAVAKLPPPLQPPDPLFCFCSKNWLFHFLPIFLFLFFLLWPQFCKPWRLNETKK